MEQILHQDYDDITDRTADLMGLADVHRWGVIKMGRNQSVAEHSFNVAVISLEIMDRLGYSAEPRFVAKVLFWALVHDVPETLTGDIDGKFKRDYPEVRAAVVAAENEAFGWYREAAKWVSPEELAIVKLADKIEAIQYIQYWGTGARADDVTRELLTILWQETVPKCAAVVGIDEEQLTHITRRILHHSVSENNCYQLRRFRPDDPRRKEIGSSK